MGSISQYDFVERLLGDPHRLTDTDFADLRGAFTERELVELLLFTGLEVGLDRFCIALNLDTTDENHYPSDLDATGLRGPNQSPSGSSVIATWPRSGTSPSSEGLMSNSKTSFGIASVEQALGMSTIPLWRPSTGTVESSM